MMVWRWMRSAGRAFRHRNYRLFFGGQFISLIGTWINSVAMSWLVYRLSNSELMLGIVAFCGQIPSLLVSPVAGVFADRWNRRRVQIATSLCFTVQSAAMALLTISGCVTLSQIVFLSLVQGVILAFEVPSRQAFITQMVPAREDLSNAIALNSALFNGARLVGPAIGGWVIATSGEGVCFALNSLSYLAVVWALIGIRVAEERKTETRHPWAEMKEGFAYVYSNRLIRALLMFVALTSMVGTPYIVLMPVFAREVFAGGPQLLGVLMTSSGLGALTGAIVLAARHSHRGLDRVTVAAAMLSAGSLAAFAVNTNLLLAFVLLFLSGLSFVIIAAACNTLVQAVVDDQLRGRVMSLFAVAFMGMMPFGSLLTGALANRWGAPFAVFICGLLSAATAFWFRIALPRGDE